MSPGLQRAVSVSSFGGVGNQRIVLIGERDTGKRAHLGIEASVALYRREANPGFEFEWVGTAAITPERI